MATITQNWENDGALEIHDAKTINLYLSLTEKKRNVDITGRAFYAFSEDDFKRGLASLNMPKGEKLYRTELGLYGTKKGLDSIFSDMAEIDKEIAEKCDPQEVYYYEWNNFEAMYGSGEENAFNRVSSIFGAERAAIVKRLNY